MSGRIVASAAAVVLALAICTPASAIPGACCLEDNACVLYTWDECSAAGGTYWGDGTPCSPDPCRPGFGVCCSYYGECSIRTFSECVQDPGVCAWMEGMTSCDPNPCPACCPIACCLPDQSCRVVGCGEDCAAIGGTWIPGKTFCHPNPCIVCDVPNDDGDGDRVRMSSWGMIRSVYR
jgi:hypothetical protein